jgi:hypothetical protein
MSELTTRQYQIYVLPLDPTVVLRPEQAVLQIEGRKTVDLGLLCYRNRSSERRSRKTVARKVDVSTINPKRIAEMRTVIETLSLAIDSGRKTTWYKKCVNFVAFVELCDEHGHQVDLNDEISCRSALKWFVLEMWRLVNQHERKLSSASLYQDHVISMLNLILETDDLAKGLNLLRRDYNLTEPTPIPDDAAQSKSLAWFFCLFNGISDLVLNIRPYPFPLTVPGYIQEPENRIWLFPVLKWYAAPGEIGAIHTDYQLGRIRLFDEVSDLYSHPYVARRDLKSANAAIDQANSAPYHPSRVERGMLAMKAFIMLFHAATGINPSQAAEIRWDEVLRDSIDDPTVARQNFRGIKYRASGIIVNFQVGVQFMPDLRKYVQLRNFLLGGTESEWFFFSLGLHLEKEPRQIIQGSAESSLLRIISKFDPSIKTIGPREWRAAKNDSVTRNYGPVASAVALQHSLPTALKSYNNGSPIDHEVEMAAYWEAVERKVILLKSEKITGSEEIALGICASPKNPQPSSSTPPVTPDCKGPEGCLFCNQYRAHADATDIRKLLSAKFCLKAISHRAETQEEFDSVFAATLQRIDEILQKIRIHENEMVEKIASEIAEGKLHRYWQSKMEIFMELELL